MSGEAILNTKLTFVRFKASDSVELQGWLSNVDGDTAVVHMHGMSGNGYENYFLDHLRAMFIRRGISFFAIDNRGRGVVSSFWQGGRVDTGGESTKLGGSCFEIFEESAADIRGAIDYLRSLGKTKFILQGHSLGGSKVVNCLVTQRTDDIIAAVLLAPTDMVGWASVDPNHGFYMQRAKDLLARGQGTELVGAECWLDKTPLSAQTYPTICEAGTAVDIYGERVGGALLGRVNVPMLIVYGDDDIGITKIDNSMNNWVERVDRIKSDGTKIAILKDASHSYKNHEDKLAKAVESFIASS